MSPDIIKAVTFALAILVVLAYGLFVRWRIRVHRERRELEAEQNAATTTRSAEATLFGAAACRSFPTATVPAEPPRRSPAPTAGATSVLEAVAGISLPHDLVPHPDATPRAAALDRVALVGSTIPVELLRAGVEEALVAIGYELAWAGEEGLARRDGTELRVSLYDAPQTTHTEGRPAFPMAPTGSVIVDFWISDPG